MRQFSTILNNDNVTRALRYLASISGQSMDEVSKPPLRALAFFVHPRSQAKTLPALEALMPEHTFRDKGQKVDYRGYRLQNLSRIEFRGKGGQSLVLTRQGADKWRADYKGQATLQCVYYCQLVVHDHRIADEDWFMLNVKRYYTHNLGRKATFDHCEMMLTTLTDAKASGQQPETIDIFGRQMTPRELEELLRRIIDKTPPGVVRSRETAKQRAAMAG